MNEDLRYPIGNFHMPQEVTAETREKFIPTIERLPEKLREIVEDLSDEQLDTSYRPEGWTIRQLVHHIADSHINSFCRFKFGMSEQTPTIKVYNEAIWAETTDSKTMPIEASLKILEGIHARWTALLKSMNDDDYNRKIVHPEHGEMTLGNLLALYDWHSRHHTAHITNLRDRKGWRQSNKN